MLHLDHPTPADHGFRMPAEWGPHAATWTSWPADDELWEGHLDAVREEFTGLVATLCALRAGLGQRHRRRGRGRRPRPARPPPAPT